MAASLRAEAERRGIRRIEDIRELRIIPQVYTEERILGLVNRFAQAYGDKLVLYGGITATEWIYGRKRIRSITSDLDFVCTEEGLEAVLASEDVSYHARYDILYTVAENVSVSFTFRHIHDWLLRDEFFAATKTSSPFGIPLRHVSREHAIALKLRRTDERIRRGLLPFGKDALDVLNMLDAPACGSGELDMDALCELIASAITTDPGRIGAALRFVGGYGSHLTQAEREAISPLWNVMRSRFGVSGDVAIVGRDRA